MSYLNKLSKLSTNTTKNLLARDRYGNRYDNFKTFQPSGYALSDKLKNNNPHDKYIMKKDLGEININVEAGNEAPLAYIGKKEFPGWYKPYLSNHNGNGFLLILFSVFSVIAYYKYKKIILEMGLECLPTNKKEDTVVAIWAYGTQFNRLTNANLKTPMHIYVERYMKESGF